LPLDTTIFSRFSAGESDTERANSTAFSKFPRPRVSAFVSSLEPSRLICSVMFFCDFIAGASTDLAAAVVPFVVTPNESCG